jgi:hypothetical protein
MDAAPILDGKSMPAALRAVALCSIDSARAISPGPTHVVEYAWTRSLDAPPSDAELSSLESSWQCITREKDSYTGRYVACHFENVCVEWAT